MARKCRTISADSHLEISPERWRQRTPAKFRDRAPRLVKLPNGGDAILIENRPLSVLGLALTGKPYQEYRPTGVISVVARSYEWVDEVSRYTGSGSFGIKLAVFVDELGVGVFSSAAD